MYIASTLTATKSIQDVPVLVLTFRAKGRPNELKRQSITDLVSIAHRVFGFPIDAPLGFRTVTLDVCRDVWTEIDESAYELLLSCLDEVNVYVKTEANSEIDDRFTDMISIPQRTNGPVQASIGALGPTMSKAQAQPLSESTGPRQSKSKTVDADLEPTIDLKEHDEGDDEEEVYAMIEADEREAGTESEVEEPARNEDTVQPKRDEPKVKQLEEEDVDFWRFGMKGKEPDTTLRRDSRHQNPHYKKGKVSITRAR
ncbi:hypothetical protein H0H92_014959, partial [Tricholoma furcatifolium]